jgi:hypothetical protein
MRTHLRRTAVAAALTGGAAVPTVGVAALAVAALAVVGLVAAFAVAAVGLATPARADVTVQPAEAVQGEEAVVTFAVSSDPTGSNDSNDSTGSTRGGIVKVRVSVPTAAKLTSVRTKPVAGWSADVFKARVPQAGDVCDCTAVPTVTSITWTAHAGVSIAPGTLEEFAVLVERLPKQASLAFITTQTYADGTTVRSPAPGRAGAASPANRAPRLVLRPAPAEASDLVPAAAKSDAPATTADPVARWLVAAGMLLCLAALAVAGLGVTRRHHPR